MSLGRKKSSSQPKTVTIAAPPPITKVSVSTPGGDQFITTTQNGEQTFQSNLSAETKATVAESLKALQTLVGELNRPDAVRQTAINQRSQDFYDLQAANINAEADDQLSRTRSNLAKRFGGAYNATFGTNLLAQLEGNRLNQLSQARKEASMYGEDLFQQDEDNRVRRFSLFQNYLADLNNQARGLQSNGSSLLLSETQRASNLAAQRAELAQRASYNDAMLSVEQSRANRENALRLSSQIALALIGG